MKKLILIICLLTDILCYGQNVLYLKNGDKLNGKLEEMKSDVLIYKTHGTSIKFAISDVSAIFFDDKLKLNDVEVLNNSKNAKQNSSKIYGVVTYFFNRNIGAKPDIGAKIFVADSTKLPPECNLEDVLRFQKALSYSFICSYNKNNNEPIPNVIQNEIVKLNLVEVMNNKTAFDELDNISNMNILRLNASEKVIKTVADGIGNFSVKVPSGTYYILIESNNRKGNTMTEIMGKIYCKKIIIKDGDEISINENFK